MVAVPAAGLSSLPSRHLLQFIARLEQADYRCSSIIKLLAVLIVVPVLLPARTHLIVICVPLTRADCLPSLGTASMAEGTASMAEAFWLALIDDLVQQYCYCSIMKYES